MNAELIKALRRCSYETVAGADREDGYCKPCAYFAEDTSDITCIDRMMIDAADALEAAEKRIKELEAQIPKDGEWIAEPMTREKFYNDPYLFAKCSICGENSRERGRYCPNCGSRMRKGEQE